MSGKTLGDLTAAELADSAYNEFRGFIDYLKRAGVPVTAEDKIAPVTADDVLDLLQKWAAAIAVDDKTRMGELWCEIERVVRNRAGEPFRVEGLMVGAYAGSIGARLAVLGMRVREQEGGQS